MGYAITTVGLAKNYSPSDVVLVVNSGSGVGASDVYAPMPNTKLLLMARIGQNSLFRFKFKMRDNGAFGQTMYCKIYRNGVAIGTEQTTTSTVYVEKVEDIVATGWLRGDVLQIYGHRSGLQNLPRATDMSLCGAGSEWEAM